MLISENFTYLANFEILDEMVDSIITKIVLIASKTNYS